MIYLYQWGCKAAEDLCRQKEQAGQLWWLLYRLCTAIKACVRRLHKPSMAGKAWVKRWNRHVRD